MELLVIVTSIALLQVFVFAIQVGSARVKYGVNAPAISGAPEFDRAFRVHQNTLEQLILLIPSMWMFAQFWRADHGATNISRHAAAFILADDFALKSWMQDTATFGLTIVDHLQDRTIAGVEIA